MTTFTTGTYGNLTFSFSNVPTGALSGTGAINGGASRVVFTCDPNLPRGERTFERQFRTECVAPPTDQFRLGTALNDEYLGPGYMNWDISVFKNVPLGGARRLQFRVELYNAFNSDQWTAVNTNANFDYDRGADQPDRVRQAHRGHVERAAYSARRASELLTSRVVRVRVDVTKGRGPSDKTWNNRVARDM